MNEDLIDELALLKDVLKSFRTDVLALRQLENLLLSADDFQAIFGHLADISCVKPPVFERIGTIETRAISVQRPLR